MPMHFKNSKFHFHYESDPSFDRLAQFVLSKNACTQIIARSVLNLFKKSVFKILILVVVVQFRQAHLKKPDKIQW